MNTGKFLSEFRCSPKTREVYGRYLSYIDEWRNDILSPGEFEKLASSRDWSANTARLALAAYKAYLKHFGVDAPILNYIIKRTPPPPQRAITRDKVERLLRVCNPRTKSGMQYVVIILTLYDTWIRANELCNLRVEHLDLENNKLTVLAKGGVWHTPVYSDLTKAHLEAWLIERIGIARHDCPTVFCNSYHGTPLTRDGLRGNFNRLGKKAGFKVSPHDFRRGGPSRAAKNGMPDRIGMLQGNWKDHRQYQHYTSSLTTDDVKPFFQLMS